MKRTVLVVDDDPGLLRLIEQFLVAEGFRVLAEGSTQAGMTHAEGPAPLDLAIVDFWLDGQPSTDVLDSLRDHRPDLPVIMMTGGNADVPIETSHAVAQVSGAVSFLQKPFPRATLVAEVRRLLG